MNNFFPPGFIYPTSSAYIRPEANGVFISSDLIKYPYLLSEIGAELLNEGVLHNFTITKRLFDKFGITVHSNGYLIMDGKEYRNTSITRHSSTGRIDLNIGKETFQTEFFNKLEEYCKNKFRELVKGVLLEKDKSSAILQSEIKQLRKEIKETKQSVEMTETKKTKDLREFYISSIGKIENRIKILQQKLKRSDKHFFSIDKKTGQFIS